MEINRKYFLFNLSALIPGGIRLGTPAVTSRGMKEDDMEKIAEFLMRTVDICLKTQNKIGKNLGKILEEVKNDVELKTLENDIEEFTSQFSVPGENI